MKKPLLHKQLFLKAYPAQVQRFFNMLKRFVLLNYSIGLVRLFAATLDRGIAMRLNFDSGKAR